MTIVPLTVEPFEILDELAESRPEEEPAVVDPAEGLPARSMEYSRIDRDFVYSSIPGHKQSITLREDIPSQMFLVGTKDPGENRRAGRQGSRLRFVRNLFL